jgi:TetR/AcrR family transcriptional regulator, regulator of mycofactocin system
MTGSRRLPGRPPTTSRDEVQRVALGLFASKGFEATTLDDVAAAVGVSRRTLFRYYPSKNDIVWGDFDWVLKRLRRLLDEADPETPLLEALASAAVASNRYDPEVLPELRIRMTLITTVPSLQGHAMLRYAEWRAVVAEFVARRLGLAPDDLEPEAIGHTALGASMAAFQHWVRDPGSDLEDNLRRTYRLLADGLGS